MSNPYIPYAARIKDIRQETEGERPIKTFTVEFADEKTWDSFKQQDIQIILSLLINLGLNNG